MVFLAKIFEPIEAPANPPANTQPEKVPQYVSQHHFVGLITQLGALTSYANDVFTELMDLAGATYNRITQLGTRANNIAQLQTNFESYLKSTTVEKMLSNPRGAYTASTAESQQFTQSTQSKAIKDLYAKSSPPPNFSLVNPFMENGQDAYKQYSNPNFFLDEWIQEQSRLREEAKKARRERRRQRAERRQDDKTNPEQVVEVAKMKVVKYDPLTGEKIIVDAGPARSVQRATSAMTLTPNKLSTVVSLDDAPPPSTVPYPTQPPPVTIPMYSAPAPPSFMQDSPAPPISYATLRGTQQSPSTPVYQQPQQQSWNAPPPPPSHAPAPSPYTAAPAAPPPPAPAPPPPPPDAPPAPSGLLSALSQTKLKTAAPVESKAKPVDARSGLMESIRSGIELKSTKERAMPEKTAPKEEATVANILSRRIAFAGSSSSDDESDDDGEWD